MAEETGGEKTEAATPKRRQEARDEGNVARSPDLSAAVLLIGGMLLLRWFGGGVVQAMGILVRDMLGKSSLSDPGTDGISAMVLRSGSLLGAAMAPLFIGLMVIAILVNVAQKGLLFNVAKLTPNFAALNPTRGLSRIFGGGQGLVKFALGILKLLLVGLMAYSAVHGRIGQIILVQQLSFFQIFSLAGDLIFSIAIRIGILLLILAVMDYMWQRHHIEQGLRMSKQEVKDEMKNMDGDPRLKLRRRQLAMARLKEQLKNDVPKADVVVTNPTEFAVALQYEPDSMNAPTVVAKGQGYIAARIRELAIANGIPILERKPLARALYKICKVGQEVPEQYFSAIAEILAYVYELNGRFKQKHFAKAG
jgi:flagellar biosynthetic protein FlhB